MTTLFPKSLKLALGGWICLAGFMGCAALEPPPPTDPTTPSADPASLAVRFANVPIPPGFDLDRSKSFIYESGSGAVKVGRLYLSGWNAVDEVIQFFRNEMVAKGWSPISIMEQQVTLMVFEREDQVCTLMVEPSFGKTHVQIHVGPR
ncbi:MAG: hypothetical protein ACE5ER_08455 [Nitrospinaceae bacterium]